MRSVGVTSKPYRSDNSRTDSRAAARSTANPPHFVGSTPSVTFSATVIGSTNMKCWWIIPTPAAMASRGESNRWGGPTGVPSASVSIPSPFTYTSPAVGSYNPYNTFISVVLPAPFSPSNAWTDPRSTRRSTSSLASTPGKRFVIASKRTASICLCRRLRREGLNLRVPRDLVLARSVDSSGETDTETHTPDDLSRTTRRTPDDDRSEIDGTTDPVESNADSPSDERPWGR